MELKNLKKSEIDEYRMSYCLTCIKRTKTEFRTVNCSITSEYPNFTNECENFELDEKELDEILNITNSRLREYFKIIKNSIEQKRTVYPREYLELNSTIQTDKNRNIKNSIIKGKYDLDKIYIVLFSLFFTFLAYKSIIEINIKLKTIFIAFSLMFLYLIISSINKVFNKKNEILIKEYYFQHKGKKHFWNDIIKVGYGEIQDKYLTKFLYLSKISDSNYNKFKPYEVSNIEYEKLIVEILKNKRKTK